MNIIKLAIINSSTRCIQSSQYVYICCLYIFCSIQRAILENDPKRLGKLLGQRVKLRLSPEDMALALMEAISQGKAECVPPLLTAKADPNCVDEDGKTPLIVCMESKAGGSPPIVRDLLKAGASPNKATHNTQQTALHMAARKGYQVAVKVLISNGARADKADAAGNTALSYCAREGHFTALKMLLEAGANPDMGNKQLETPLMLAAKSGHLDSAEELLECGANPDNRDAKGQTPLMLALKGNHMDMVELLMSYQCAMNTQNIQTGKTILHWAVQTGDIKLIQSVLRMGAEPNIRDKEWETPFLTALLNKRLDIVDLLVKYKCDIKVTDKHFNTGLHLAAREGLLDLLPMFIGAGLDCNLKTSAGQTPLMLAAFGGHEAIVSFLLEHGGNAEVMDRHRATALVYAIMSRAADKSINNIVKILVRTGCDLSQRVNLQKFLSGNSLNKDDRRLRNLESRPYPPIEIAFLRGRPLAFLMLLRAGCSLRDFALDILKQGNDWLSPKRTDFRTVLYLLKNVKTAKKQFPSLKELCRRPAVKLYKDRFFQAHVSALHPNNDVLSYLKFDELDGLQKTLLKAVAATREQSNNTGTGTGHARISDDSPFSRMSNIRSTYSLGSTPRRHTTTNSSGQSFRSSESSEEDDVFRRGMVQVNRKSSNSSSQGSTDYARGTEQWVMKHTQCTGTPKPSIRTPVKTPKSPMRTRARTPTIPQSPFSERKLTPATRRRPRLNSAKSPPTIASMLFANPPISDDVPHMTLGRFPNRDSVVSNDTGFQSEDLQRPESPTEKVLHDLKSAIMWKDFTSPLYDSWDNESVDSAGVASVNGSLDSRETDLSDFSRGSNANDIIRPMMNGSALANGYTPTGTPTTPRRSRIPVPRKSTPTSRGTNHVTISSQFLEVDDEGPGVLRRTKSCRKY